MSEKKPTAEDMGLSSLPDELLTEVLFFDTDAVQRGHRRVSSRWNALLSWEKVLIEKIMVGMNSGKKRGWGGWGGGSEFEHAWLSEVVQSFHPNIVVPMEPTTEFWEGLSHPALVECAKLGERFAQIWFT